MKKPKIDEYMPFFYRQFFQAIEGLPDEWAMKYLRAICYYWDKRCVGIPNDDMLMKNVCRCESHDWERLRPIIFGQFFKQEVGLWQQPFARSKYTSAIQSADLNRKKTEAARRAQGKL